MKVQILIIFLFWISGINCDSDSNESRCCGMKQIFYWASLKYKFPNTTIRDQAISSGSYVPKNNDILAIAVWKNKLFVAVFRFSLGVASSLNYICLKTKSKSPTLIPFPSFDDNYVNYDPIQRTTSLRSNSTIINSAYMNVDKCDRLWIVDSGLDDFYGTPVVIAPAALVIFNLKTNQLIRRYTIPAEQVNSNSIYGNLVVDIDGNNCDDAYVYIADMFRAIIVYSFKNNRSWRVVHSYFGSDPQSGNFFYEQINFQWNFGVFGLAMGARQDNGSKPLYVSAFSSTELYSISNDVLQNETYIANNKYFYDFIYLGDRGEFGQLFSLTYDKKTNVLFDTRVGSGRIGCWNSKAVYTNSSFGVVYENQNKFFPADVAIDCKRNLWILSNRLPLFLFGTWDPSDKKNMRIYKRKVDCAIKNTVCKYCNKD